MNSSVPVPVADLANRRIGVPNILRCCCNIKFRTKCFGRVCVIRPVLLFKEDTCVMSLEY